MKVLSLFDGMSCGQIALNRIGINIEKYYACEVDKYAMQVTQKNHPNTVQLGDVTEADFTKLDIDLVIGGSPCQGFSFAGKGLAFDDPRSRLFFEFVRAVKECKPKYFLLENVRMKKEYLDIISEYLFNVEPVMINSNLVSAQNRVRYYWVGCLNENGEYEKVDINQPDDKGIVLQNILEDDYIADKEKSHCIDANYFKGGNLKSYFEKHRRQLVFSKDGLCHVGNADIQGFDCIKRVYHPDGKSPTVSCNLPPKILNINHVWDKSNLTYRKLTPIECERLQTVPDNYTYGVSNTQRYKMLGNGWTVDVITHILDTMIGDNK